MHHRRIVPFALIVLFFSLLFVSCKETVKTKMDYFSDQQKMITDSPYSGISYRLIGPDQTSGRCTDVIGIDGDTNTIYAAFATGGLWKTSDGGRVWIPLFDNQATLSIGDIAMAPSDHNVLYIGTGEANIFRASLPGIGVYKTSDGGETFSHLGLENTGTISRIVVDPTNPDIVYVAASGNEWTANEDRGLYKSLNGGQTWDKILFESNTSGCIDLVMDPKDPKILYASMWNRTRTRWSDPKPEDGDFIYKSINGGNTWSPIVNGLPDTKSTGRIGLAVSESNPDVLYAFVDDHNTKREPKPDEMDSYQRKVQKVVIGGAIYRSSDKGESWEKRGEVHDFFTPFSGTYGWVFSQIRVHPQNENEVYVLGVNMGVSVDGGTTWKKFESDHPESQNIHGDNHAMWFDHTDPNRIILGNDGGVSTTFDRGVRWKNFFDKIPTTQFYTVTYDMQTPFNIYGSIQDEGTMSACETNTFGAPRDTTVRNWKYVPGGEGTQIQLDPTDSNIIFSSSFYGRLMRSDMSKPRDESTTPVKDFEVGRIDSLRGEWLAATLMSKFDHNVVYHGLQHLYKTNDSGTNWTQISPDLSYNDPSKMGKYPYLIYHQTITALAEGNKAGILYAGTDDGRVWSTTDDGASWSEITSDLPANKHVIKITTSAFDSTKVYVVLNDRRQDNLAPYLFKSNDSGKTWTSISSNLPFSPANVIIEDLNTANTLYCGTDMGAYVSHDDGKSWQSINGNMPNAVSVNDMFIHPRDKKLVLGTYGRGVYVLDDMSVLK